MTIATCPAVEVRGLSKTAGCGMTCVQILRDVDLTVAAGEFVAVTGPSGSGKSTLLHHAAGLDRPTTGTVRICGQDLTPLDDDARALLRRRQIGLVFQAFHLVDVMTALENVALPLAIAGCRDGEARARSLKALDQVGLAHRAHHRPAQMSGGEQQRVAVARALVANAPLIFADEPTGNLDSDSSRRVMLLLRDLVDRLGVALLLVTHDPACADMADRIVFLRDGQVERTTIPVPMRLAA